MITLIVEDGTEVVNANSYASIAYARTFAESIGVVLPTDDETLKASLLGAMLYVESQPYQGQRNSATQALNWPRKLVLLYGNLLSSNTIPINVRQAQVVAASMIYAGIDLTPVNSGQLIKREKVGPIETEYADPSSNDGASIFTAIDLYLKPLTTLIGGYRLSSNFLF